MTNKTYLHDITEILLKEVLNTISPLSKGSLSRRISVEDLILLYMYGILYNVYESYI